MHTLLDLRGPIPSFIHVSNGKMGDALALDLITPEAGAIYVMDRGYVDFRRLHVFHAAHAFFVTRAKSNMKYHRVYSRPVDKSAGILADQSVVLDGFYTSRDYPEHLRRIRFCDPDTNKRLVFLTNNFALPAETIAALYKKRWQVELFFKWVKQNLRIKHFLRDIRECSEDANLDSRECLRHGGNHQKGTGARNFSLHFFTDFVGPPLRKTPASIRISRRRRQLLNACLI
jgi:hypothetical protein